MSKPWHPQHDITLELARELIERHFPDLAPARVEPFAEGWDNRALLINGTHVFRFPRRDVAIPLIEAESRILPAMARLAEFPIPFPDLTHIAPGDPSESRYRHPYFGYPFLPGKPLYLAHPTDGQRADFAAPFAAFLGALHAIPLAQLQGLDLPTDEYERMDMTKQLERARTRLEEARAGFDVDPDPAHDRILDQTPTDYVARVDTLVHADLHAMNILVDGDQSKVTGIIDWGDVHLGDPTVDLAAAHMLLPPPPSPAHERFRHAYALAITQDQWSVARMKALHFSVAALPYAHELPTADLIQDIHTTLGYLAQ